MKWISFFHPGYWMLSIFIQKIKYYLFIVFHVVIIQCAKQPWKKTSTSAVGHHTESLLFHVISQVGNQGNTNEVFMQISPSSPMAGRRAGFRQSFFSGRQLFPILYSNFGKQSMNLPSSFVIKFDHSKNRCPKKADAVFFKSHL